MEAPHREPQLHWSFNCREFSDLWNVKMSKLKIFPYIIKMLLAFIEGEKGPKVSKAPFKRLFWLTFLKFYVNIYWALHTHTLKKNKSS